MAKATLVLLVAFAGLCLVTLSAALPGGAPTSACETMMPRHTGVQPQQNQAPYTITVGATSVDRNKQVTVRLEGPDYRGLLLQARSPDSNTALGSWINPPADTKNLECSKNSRGAITHSNTNVKTNSTTYTWMSMDTDCAIVIRFMATVAQDRERYWLNISSADVMKKGAMPCGAAEKITWTSAVFLLVALQSFRLLGCLP